MPVPEPYRFFVDPPPAVTGRDKHLRDIRFMLACTEVDRGFLDEQIARLGLREQWAACQPAAD